MILYCKGCMGNFCAVLGDGTPQRIAARARARKCPDCGTRLRLHKPGDPDRPAWPIDWPIDERLRELAIVIESPDTTWGRRRWAAEERGRLEALQAKQLTQRRRGAEKRA